MAVDSSRHSPITKPTEERNGNSGGLGIASHPPEHAALNLL
jgi:hypothetical protein